MGLILSMFLASCGTAEHDDAVDVWQPLQATLGRACSPDNPCPERMFCSSQVPEGFCTVLSCNATDRLCGEDGYCVQPVDSDPFCLPTCVDNDCPDSFRCVGVDGSRVCAPAILAKDEVCSAGSALCQAGLICARIGGSDPVCRPRCALGVAGVAVCDPGESCVALADGSINGVCVPLGTSVEGQACSVPYGVCAPELRCVFTSAHERDGACRRPCDPVTPTCPVGTRCAALDDGSAACLPVAVSLVGEPCDSSTNRVCESGLLCLKPSESSAGTCVLTCSTCPSESGDDLAVASEYLANACGQGWFCRPETATQGLCTPWAGTLGAGDLCVRDLECAPGFVCVYEADYASTGVCRPACVPSCPALACDVAATCVPFGDDDLLGACL